MVIANLLPEIAKNNIQQLIDAGKKIKISKETISIDYDNLKKIKYAHEILKKRMDDENQPDKDRIKARKEGYDYYLKQLEDVLEAADPVLVELNYQIKKEESLVIEEIKKKNQIKARHIEFVNDTTKMIALAESNKDLAKVQSLIGTEKSRSSFYGDYFPVISDVCDALLSLIDDRKKIIKENDKLKKEYEMWRAAGDTTKAIELKGKIEQNDRFIHQNIEDISQKAYNQVSDVALMDTEFISASIIPRLHRWSWRVDDIEKLYHKRPSLVIKEPNVKAINSFMKEHQVDGELDELEDNLFDGLVLYKKPFFVAVKTKSDAS